MPDKELMLDHEVALKRKRTSRVIAFSLLGIVLALVVLIIVGACVTIITAIITNYLTKNMRNRSILSEKIVSLPQLLRKARERYLYFVNANRIM